MPSTLKRLSRYSFDLIARVRNDFLVASSSLFPPVISMPRKLDGLLESSNSATNLVSVWPLVQSCSNDPKLVSSSSKADDKVSLSD